MSRLTPHDNGIARVARQPPASRQPGAIIYTDASSFDGRRAALLLALVTALPEHGRREAEERD